MLLSSIGLPMPVLTILNNSQLWKLRHSAEHTSSMILENRSGLIDLNHNSSQKTYCRMSNLFVHTVYSGVGKYLFAFTQNNMALIDNVSGVGLLFLQVAQYIKLEMPVLQSFIEKLKEEENREMEKLKQKYVLFTVIIITVVLFLKL